jgi:hypothetical protein
MFQVIVAIIVLLTTAIGWVTIALAARSSTSSLGGDRDLQQPDKSP